MIVATVKGAGKTPIDPDLVRDNPRFTIKSVGRCEAEESHAEYRLDVELNERLVCSLQSVALIDTKVAGRNAIVTNEMVFMGALSFCAAALIRTFARLSRSATRLKARWSLAGAPQARRL